MFSYWIGTVFAFGSSLGALLRRLGSLLGRLEAILGVLERSEAVPEAFRTILEASWTPLGRHRRRGTGVWGLSGRRRIFQDTAIPARRGPCNVVKTSVHL